MENPPTVNSHHLPLLQQVTILQILVLIFISVKPADNFMRLALKMAIVKSMWLRSGDEYVFDDDAPKRAVEKLPTL